MEWAALIISIVALVPLLVFLIRRCVYSPRIEIRVGGEQRGEPIRVPERGDIFFAISTKSPRKMFIDTVWVNYDNETVDLSKTKGGEERFTTDSIFSSSVFFSQRRAVKANFPQATYVKYGMAKPEFMLKIIVAGELDETELPSWLSLSPATKLYAERLVRFRVDKEYQPTIQENGLEVHPQEHMQMEGEQAQSAVWAATSQGTADIKVKAIHKKSTSS